jgi:catechol 2,3-dioxygenase-like lactoylglutathione lyase family enzyme
MRLNQVTVTMPDLDAGWVFYRGLGLVPIVDARPDYVRFVCPDGGSTFSLHQGDASATGTTVYFECDELNEWVERLKAARIQLYWAGKNRLDPPWRIEKTNAP